MNSAKGVSSGGAYRPPRLRQSGSAKNTKLESFGNKNSSSSTSLNPTSEELAKRRDRFANDKLNKQDNDYGLISRGEDNRLQRDPSARVAYFKKIQNDFAQTFSKDDVGSLRRILAGLNLEDEQGKKEDEQKSEKFDQILLSLRKLREALLKFSPDDFAKSVFLFSIRISTRVGHYQTYIPSITYLLKHESILSKEELQEIVSLYVLHLSHFNKNDQLALEIALKYSKEDIWLQRVLRSWRNLEYKTWFELYSSEKDYSKTRIMQFGEDKMVSYAISCLQKSYFRLPKGFIEQLFHKNVDQLMKRSDCSWKLDENTVIIRSRT